MGKFEGSLSFLVGFVDFLLVFSLAVSGQGSPRQISRSPGHKDEDLDENKAV